jgi:uncharacterized protein YbbC (DUF1343 family)
MFIAAENKKVALSRVARLGFVVWLAVFLLSACSTSANDLSAKPKLEHEHEFEQEQLQTLLVGAQRSELYLPMLTGKRVGLVVNQTSMVAQQHLVDFLLSKNVNVAYIFAPEHGFRGDHDAGEKFDSGIDQKTGIKLVSIYGKHRKPPQEIMAELDVILFDIQDVGVRFYTYISSMHYMMEAAAEADVEFLVLDRPNPNGRFVDGPILEPEFTSFVGMHKIPLLHGMTIGELAQLFRGEGWLQTDKTLKLSVVKVAHYQRDMLYSLPVKPSPNLPNDRAIALYPSLGFFEATPVSIGRGTDFPFQVIGHDKISLGEFSFTPVSMPGSAKSPKLMDKKLKGQDLRASAVSLTASAGLDLSYIIHWHRAFAKAKQPFFTRAGFMDKLSGTDKLRKAIEAGLSEEEIKQTWVKRIAEFKSKREPYLIY